MDKGEGGGGGRSENGRKKPNIKGRRGQPRIPRVPRFRFAIFNIFPVILIVSFQQKNMRGDEKLMVAKTRHVICVILGYVVFL